MAKALVATGRVIEYPSVVLAELSKEFDGSAEAAGTAWAGKIATARVEELPRRIGKLIVTGRRGREVGSGA
jgi:hypothetical protein